MGPEAGFCSFHDARRAAIVPVASTELRFWFIRPAKRGEPEGLPLELMDEVCTREHQSRRLRAARNQVKLYSGSHRKERETYPSLAMHAVDEIFGR